MHFNIVTLFPEFFTTPLQCSLLHRAQQSGSVSFDILNLRSAATDNRKTVDDTPYGGGPGMVLLPQPVASTLNQLGFQKKGNLQPGKLIMLSPSGKPFTQKIAQELAKETSITLLCGRYEGFDARIENYYPVETISTGDFVLNGGETAALCLIEAVSRLLPNFMGDDESATEESFSDGLLEYPHYTRPIDFNGLEVPAVLRSGDHGRIASWRRQQSLCRTFHNRPDLLSESSLSDSDYAYLRSLPSPNRGRNLYCALVHYPVLNKFKKTVAVSLTNLDIHDIGRSSYTYGLGSYYVVTPIEDQQALLQEIIAHWTTGSGKESNPSRDAALQHIKGAASLEEAIADVKKRTGRSPFVAGTAAKIPSSMPGRKTFSEIRDMLDTHPVLLVFGTGHGLAPEATALCHAFLPPLRWHGTYNHLSVRSAAAIMMDRILRDWE